MGYCHVAQPVYLAAGDLREALVCMIIHIMLIFFIIIILSNEPA